MKYVGARIAAEATFVFHTGWIIILLIGWLFPQPYYDIYVAMLTVTLVTQFFFRKCVLTPLEFYFRRMYDPAVGSPPNYLTYYSHTFFPDWVTDEFVDRVSLIFLSVSILIAAHTLVGYL